MATDDEVRDIWGQAGKVHAEQFTWAASAEVIRERIEALV